MVSEQLVSRFEESFTELAEIGGEKEKTNIMPNLEVIDAAPGITGFIIIEDSKDGDYITAATIPGMIYANGDLVNVLFREGTEPIAFQQGTGSSGVAFAVDRVYRPDFTATVLTGDNSNAVTLTAGDLIIPDDIVHSGDPDTLISATTDKWTIEAGGLTLLSLTEAAQDLVEIGDVGGAGDVDVNFNNGQAFLRGSDGFFGINTTSPIEELDVNGEARVFKDGNTAFFLSQATTDGVSASYQFLKSRGTHASPTIVADGDLLGQELWKGHDGNIFQTSAILRALVEGAPAAGVVPSQLVYQTTDTAGALANRFSIHNNGDILIASAGTPSAQLHIDQSSTTAAQPVILFDQADISEEFFKFVGAAAAATLTQSFVDEGDVTTATRIGWFKINIVDVGSQITNGDYWVPFYSLA